MKVGNRIIFDQNGNLIHILGELTGDTVSRENIMLDYIDLKYGQIDYSRYRIVGVDIKTRIPILEELENQLLINESNPGDTKED